jgi:carbamoyltransferase
MDILGISFNFHDASAALIRDGHVVAAAEEERFSRCKHDHRFPEQAIAYCLAHGRVQARDLTAVAFYEKPVRKAERTLRVANSYPNQSHDLLRRQLSQYLSEDFTLKRLLYEKIGYEGPLHYSEHHLSHAASAFYLSPFDEAAVLTVDGVGEWATTAQFAGTGTRLIPLREIQYPHSLGLLYSTITAFLGFQVNEDEYKVMGLASYGVPRYRNEFDKLIRLFADGSFALALEYFSYPYSDEHMHAEPLVELLGQPRLPAEAITDRHRDIAASLQVATENAITNLAQSLRTLHPSNHLCMAGGVAYNCVANAKVARCGGYRHLWVQPAAGDSGASLGAALVSYYAATQPVDRRPSTNYDTRLGPSFGIATIRSALRKAGLAFQQLSTDELCRSTAGLISRGAIVGWFQGRMEFGPRALGGRSILANPCDPQTKDILNRRIKFREDFRPFAPAVIEEAARRYFDLSFTSPFMLFTARVKPGCAEKMPAITHVDGSARVQTVARRDDPLFHGLIKEFGSLTGVPVLVNTSFNVAGEPIVCTPDDAVGCFLGSGMDALAIGNFLVCK